MSAFSTILTVGGLALDINKNLQGAKAAEARSKQQAMIYQYKAAQSADRAKIAYGQALEKELEENKKQLQERSRQRASFAQRGILNSSTGQSLINASEEEHENELKQIRQAGSQEYKRWSSQAFLDQNAANNELSEARSAKISGLTGAGKLVLKDLTKII